jgi:hypothetical protein
MFRHDPKEGYFLDLPKARAFWINEGKRLYQGANTNTFYILGILNISTCILDFSF